MFKTKNSNYPHKPRRLKNFYSLQVRLTMLAGALFLGALMSFVFIRNGETKKPDQNTIRIATNDDNVIVPVPSRQIARGEKLRDVPFNKSLWPKSKVPPGALLELQKYQNSLAKISIPALVPVPLTALSSLPVEANLVAEGIPDGMRAITLKVDTESSIEGWARSGNFVDVVLIRTKDKQNSELEAKVIAENVRILSSGRSADPSSESESTSNIPTSATLLVSQEDALKIKTASSLGKITFTMRGLGDQLPTTVKTLNQRHLGSSSGKKTTFKGVAKGPNGKTWVLTDDANWIRASSSLGKLKTKYVGKQTISNP